MLLQGRARPYGASIIEARHTEAREPMFGVVSLYQVADDAADGRSDAETVPAHAGCYEQAVDCRRAVDDRHDVGHGIDHAAPACLQGNGAQLRKEALKILLDGA